MRALKYFSYSAKGERFDLYIKNNKHRIFLNYGLEIRFDRRDETEKFCKKINTDIEKTWLNLNDLYTQLFCEYRNLWGYFNGKTKEINEIAVCREIDRNSIIIINKIAEFDTNNQREVEYTEWFRQIKYIAQVIVTSAKMLLELVKNRGSYISVRKIDVIIITAHEISQLFDNYGLYHPNACIPDSHPYFEEVTKLKSDYAEKLTIKANNTTKSRIKLQTLKRKKMAEWQKKIADVEVKIIEEQKKRATHYSNTLEKYNQLIGEIKSLGLQN
jgi:predicted nucleotidyltransferase